MPTLIDFSTARLGGKCYSDNLGADLTIVDLRYPIGTTADEIARRVVRPEFVTLSRDGRAWIDGWHTGPTSPSRDETYVERHTIGGCVFHGWVDAETRRITQAG